MDVMGQVKPVFLYDLGMAHRYWHATHNAERASENVITDLFKRERAGEIVIACDDTRDDRGLYWRHDVLPSYKATRKHRPEEVTRAIAQVVESVRVHFRIAGAPGFEADDIIATIAMRAATAGHIVTVSAADKDLAMIVHERVTVLYSGRTIDDTAAVEIWGVSRSQLHRLLAMTGDAADNVPGIPGIGEKGAAILLAMYPTVAACIAAAQTGGPLPRGFGESKRKAIAGAADVVDLARRVTRPREDAPIDWADLGIGTLA